MERSPWIWKLLATLFRYPQHSFLYSRTISPLKSFPSSSTPFPIHNHNVQISIIFPWSTFHSTWTSLSTYSFSLSTSTTLSSRSATTATENSLQLSHSSSTIQRLFNFNSKKGGSVMFPSSPITILRSTNNLLPSRSLFPYLYFIFFQQSLLEPDLSSSPEFTVSLLSFFHLVSLTFYLYKPLGFYIVSHRTKVYSSRFSIYLSFTCPKCVGVG